MARNKRQRVKRYRRSFYTRGMKVRKALGILALVAVVLGAAWLAAPYVLDWATHTWYTVVRDRDLPDSSSAAASSEAVPASSEAEKDEPASSSPAASSEAASSSAASEIAAPGEGDWSVVSLSALGSEAAIRETAAALKAQGVVYALVPLKDTSGYIYYPSAVPGAAGSVAATVVDPALIASIFKENGLVPVAWLAAFQDPVSVYTDRSMGIQYAGDGGYLWLDAASAAVGGKAWMNPYAPSAVQYIGDLVEELYTAGFEQTVLANVQFPPVVSSKQSFGETGGRSRSQQLAADIAAWQERFAGRVTLWYEYPLSSCTAPDATTEASPAQLGVKNLVVRLPVEEPADEAQLAQVAQQMKDLGCENLVVRDGSSGRYY